jgi:serine/threonine protein kinase
MDTNNQTQTYKTLLAEHQGKGFSENEVTELLRQVLPQVANLHSEVEVHGAISLETLIKDNRIGRISLVPNSELLTSLCIPPEQLQTGHKTTLGDVYALGVVAIVLLTGKNLEQLQNYDGTLNWQDDCIITDHLTEILEKATAINPKERYTDAMQMLRALQPKPLAPPTVYPPPVAQIPVAPPPSIFPNHSGFQNSGAMTEMGNDRSDPVRNAAYQNKVMLLIIVALLAVGGIAGGFWISSEMAKNQAKLQESQEQARLAQERANQEQQRREQAEKLRQQAEQDRLNAERLRTEAEIRAANARNYTPPSRTIIINPNSSANTSPSQSSGQSGARIGGSSGRKNIRSGPGTRFSVVGSGLTGDAIQILGSGTDVGGYRWYKLYHPSSGTTGWIAAQLINF